jgi:hypothetical protein
MEQFNPSNPEYKKVEDLPQEEQDNYIDAGEGFVQKEAMDTFNKAKDSAKEQNKQRSLKEKLLRKKEINPIDILHGQAKVLDLQRSHPERQLIFDLVKIRDRKGNALPQIEEIHVKKLLALREQVGTEKDPEGLLYNVALMRVHSTEFPKELEKKFSKEDIWKALYLLAQDKDSMEEVTLSSEEIADWLIFNTQTVSELIGVLELEGLKGLAYDLRKYYYSGIAPHWPEDLQAVLLHAAKLIDKERPGKFN